MERQPDEWTRKLPDGRIVTYASNIGLESGGGPLSAQAEGDIKHTDIAHGPLNRQEIEAVFAGRFAK